MSDRKYREYSQEFKLEAPALYDYAGSTRVAMRKNNTVYYLLGDHLGSTSLTTDQNGQSLGSQYYLPWGEVRYSSGSLQTKYTYTGQYSNVSDFGLMYYNARWYDSLLGRFTQADSIVPQPGFSSDYDRYAYVRNNPVNLHDPSGHCYVMVNGQLSTRCQSYWKEYTPETIKSQLSSKFGVKLEGFSVRNSINMLKALYYADKALGGISQFTSGRTFSFKSDSSFYGGKTSPSGDIAFHAPSYGPPYQNVYHELAHLINFASDNYFVSLLNSHEVFTPEGEFVMGGSDRNYKRTSLGYLADSIEGPIGFYAKAQQHPGSNTCASGDDWCISGNTASEEWADLIANYVSGNFNNSPIGITRRTWVEQALLAYKLSLSGFIGGGY